MARSVCVAHCQFWITDQNRYVITQSREVKAINRYNPGDYSINLKHPMTYAKSSTVGEDVINMFSHYRIHVQPLFSSYWSGPSMISIQAIGMDLYTIGQPEDPELRHFFAIRVAQYDPETGLQMIDCP